MECLLKLYTNDVFTLCPRFFYNQALVFVTGICENYNLGYLDNVPTSPKQIISKDGFKTGEKVKTVVQVLPL